VPKDTHHSAATDQVLGHLPEQVTVAVAELASAAREGLLALAVGTGLQVLEAMLAEDVAWLVGPKGRHIPGRAAVRHGSEPGQVTLGGRRVRVQRPRVRTADGTGELPVPTYQAFAATDLLDHLVVERMLAKLSTRRYRVGLEPVGSSIEQASSGTSRSAVSRRFVARTEHALAELLAQDLSALDLVALLVDGIRVADHCCVVALGITIDGTKIPLALAEGATENATVTRDLLTGLRERGLDVTRPILVVIDGAKALRRAVGDVFDHPVIQRCQLHKLRNVTDRLPDAVAATVARRMRAAYRNPDPLVAQADLEALGVVTRKVVNAADGWPAAEGGVGSVMVVPMDPRLQGSVAGGVGAVQPPIGPLLQQGPVEPLHLPIGLRPIGTRPLVAYAGVGQRGPEQSAAVADPVVGQHPGDGDAVQGEPAVGPPPEAGAALGSLVA
jgi:transposase-like protein